MFDGPRPFTGADPAQSLRDPFKIFSGLVCCRDSCSQPNDGVFKVTLRYSGQENRNDVHDHESGQQRDWIRQIAVPEETVVPYPAQHVDEIQAVADLPEEDQDSEHRLDRS
jgi:hypothetical protein